MSRTILVYPIFIIAIILLFSTFITATTYTQLGIAILLYPLLAFFAYKIMPRKLWIYAKKPSASADSFQAVTAEGLAGNRSAGISDTDKRAFLKLIGGTGIALFLLSLFNKKTDLFSRNLPASGTVSIASPAGDKVDPAKNQATDGYNISEIDDNITSYYGYTNKDGAWYIMMVDTNIGSFRYTWGGSNFSANWMRRENLKYDYFSNVF